MTDRTPSPPAPRRTRLVVDLAIVLVVKIILLTLLWHAFIKPNKVKVDADVMSARLTGTASQPPQEKTNDRFDGR